MKKLILGITFLFALAIVTPSVASVVIDNPVKKEVQADTKVTDKKCCASADSKAEKSKCSSECKSECKKECKKEGCCKDKDATKACCKDAKGAEKAGCCKDKAKEEVK